MKELFQTIVQNFPKGLIKAILFNGGIISLSYYFIWIKYKERFKKFRIQLKERVNDKQIKREIENSLLTATVGILVSSIVLFFYSKGSTKLYINFADHPFFRVAGFFIILFVDDTWFYWTHRLLHHPKIFNLIHVEHHKSTDTNPFTTMSFHVLEPTLLSLWIFPVAFFIPTYIPILGLAQVYGLLNNIKAHLGYEFYPGWWNRTWLRYLTTSTHHNMHHSKFKGNYAVHFTIWDKLMGTEFNNYEAEFDNIKQRVQ